MGGGKPPQDLDLAGFIKAGQRADSTHFRKAWVTYCFVYGEGKCDPSRHQENFLLGFIEYIGELATHGLTTTAQAQGIQIEVPEVGAGGNKRKRHGFDEMPNKRHASDIPQSTDPTVIMLSDKCKQLQRQNPVIKDSWVLFCDQTAGGVKDPLRHDAASLQTFLASYA
eukprot:gb/GFBE01013723.1/.p1 GENE.gb/GFBE01013723.1/~~gb/GFBE01013723.1/.p1  ORF type:complete len:168 (+),score=45.35 gb/GFBE01013723.1/:1-504(+)